jgi:hypothetical protein
MRYLGELRGTGNLKFGDQTVGRADYEIEGYVAKFGAVTASGEIRMPAASLREFFGRTDVQLQTEDGRLLAIRFSDKRLPAASDCAHVEVSGDLPLAFGWRQ